MVSFPVLPERTALINVDMQNCFVHGSPFSAPDGLAVQDRINRLAAACHADSRGLRPGLTLAEVCSQQVAAFSASGLS
jgi:isochorismate hydrolase